MVLVKCEECGIAGIPFVHAAFGWNPETGTLRVARGIIAIGQITAGGGDPGW